MSVFCPYHIISVIRFSVNQVSLELTIWSWMKLSQLIIDQSNQIIDQSNQSIDQSNQIIDQSNQSN